MSEELELNDSADTNVEQTETGVPTVAIDTTAVHDTIVKAVDGNDEPWEVTGFGD